VKKFFRRMQSDFKEGYSINGRRILGLIKVLEHLEIMEKGTMRWMPS
jgi:hypothetical protein